jgi:hypothetical protein
MTDQRIYKKFLTEQEMQILDVLSKLDGITPEEALHRAIINEGFIRWQRGKGWKVLLEKGDEVYEVQFKEGIASENP